MWQFLSFCILWQTNRTIIYSKTLFRGTTLLRWPFQAKLILRLRQKRPNTRHGTESKMTSFCSFHWQCRFSILFDYISWMEGSTIILLVERDANDDSILIVSLRYKAGIQTFPPRNLHKTDHGSAMPGNILCKVCHSYDQKRCNLPLRVL